MTVNGVMTVILVLKIAFGAHCIKIVEDILKLSATEMLPKLLVLAIPYDDMMSGTPPLRGLNARGVDKCSDFRPIEGYISETVQDRR